MSKKVLMAIADGIEEVEMMGVVDVLKRAGAEVTVASVQKMEVTTTHHLKIIADKLIPDCRDTVFDLIVMPGGMPGSEHLRDSAILLDMLKEQQRASRWYAAICASPVVVLQHHGLLNGLKATCYPTLVNELKNKEAAHEKVVVDGMCVTSQGPGTALLFGVKLAEVLFGSTMAKNVAKMMLINLD